MTERFGRPSPSEMLAVLHDCRTCSTIRYWGALGIGKVAAIDNVLKASLIVAIALAATAVTYHYVIYIPHRDAMLDAERRAEVERVNNVEAERQIRAIRQQQEQIYKSELEKIEADKAKHEAAMRYERCKSGAEIIYSDAWSTSCTRISQAEIASYNDCISKNTSAPVCDMLQKRTTKPVNCSLPRQLAESYQHDLVVAQDRCLKEFQLGFR